MAHRRYHGLLSTRKVLLPHFSSPVGGSTSRHGPLSGSQAAFVWVLSNVDTARQYVSLQLLSQ